MEKTRDRNICWDLERPSWIFNDGFALKDEDLRSCWDHRALRKKHLHL